MIDEQFLAPYKFPLPTVPQYEVAQVSAAQASIEVTAVNDVIDEKAGTRKLTLKIDHPEVIWTGNVPLPSCKFENTLTLITLPSALQRSHSMHT